jgi:hypothetical protein
MERSRLASAEHPGITHLEMRPDNVAQLTRSTGLAAGQNNGTRSQRPTMTSHEDAVLCAGSWWLENRHPAHESTRGQRACEEERPVIRRDPQP